MLEEDHADFRRAMASPLNRQPDHEVVTLAGSPGEARCQAALVGCDVAILDLG